VGRYNKPVGNGQIEPSTPLFIVGNGDGDPVGQRSNAFEVRQDGTVMMARPQGDILMGQFGQ
jgi:hypothetical protein